MKANCDTRCLSLHQRKRQNYIENPAVVTISRLISTLLVCSQSQTNITDMIQTISVDNIVHELHDPYTLKWTEALDM